MKLRSGLLIAITGTLLILNCNPRHSGTENNPNMFKEETRQRRSYNSQGGVYDIYLTDKEKKQSVRIGAINSQGYELNLREVFDEERKDLPEPGKYIDYSSK